MGNKISSENQNELYILPLKSTNDKKRCQSEQHLNGSRKNPQKNVHFLI